MPGRYKSKGLKAVIGRWMDLIQLPSSNLRELFICRYTALLMLRGVRSGDPRCLKSGMYGVGRFAKREALVPWRHEHCADDMELSRPADRHDGVVWFHVCVRE